MKLFITTIFFVLTTKSSSQCTIILHELHRKVNDSIIIGQKARVIGGDYKSNNPKYGSSDILLREGKYKTYDSDSIIPTNFKNIVKNYIIKRSGNKFYTSLKLEKILVTNVDSIEKHDPNSYLLEYNKQGVKSGQIKYHFEYSFFPENNIIYEFGISLDKTGKIISDEALPTNENIVDLTKTIKLCDCIEKIKRQIPKTSSLSMNHFELHYDKLKNTFYYSIRFLDLASIEKRRGTFRYNSYTITSDLYTGKLSKMTRKKLMRGVF